MIAALGLCPGRSAAGVLRVLDPLAVVRKYAALRRPAARRDPRARRFVAVEDWLNDGVPLAGPVAQECLRDWYGADLPGRGLWAPGGVRGAARAARAAGLRGHAAPRPDRARGLGRGAGAAAAAARRWCGPRPAMSAWWSATRRRSSSGSR